MFIYQYLQTLERLGIGNLYVFFIEGKSLIRWERWSRKCGSQEYPDIPYDSLADVGRGLAYYVYREHGGNGKLYGNYHLEMLELIKLKSLVLRSIAICLSVAGWLARLGRAWCFVLMTVGEVGPHTYPQQASLTQPQVKVRFLSV